jgi:hypothetical protein
MGTWKNGLYWVEYGDMDERHYPEVDAIIVKANTDAFDLDWATAPNYTVGFDADGRVRAVEAWGYTEDGGLPTVRVDIPLHDKVETGTLSMNLWPRHEPKTPDMEMILGSYTTDPPMAVRVNGVWYAVGYTDSGTTYAGGGTGPVRCRLYKAETLRANGNDTIATDLENLYC